MAQDTERPQTTDTLAMQLGPNIQAAKAAKQGDRDLELRKWAIELALSSFLHPALNEVHRITLNLDLIEGLANALVRYAKEGSPPRPSPTADLFTELEHGSHNNLGADALRAD